MKKFIDDTTPIVCHNKDEFLATYDLIREIANIYGILIEDRNSIIKWDKEIDENPPTCPYSDKHFIDQRQHDECYIKMKTALATKLKTGVDFGDNFLAADIIVTNYETDGYVMLYELMTNAHPQLKRDTAQQPRKPKFDGNMAEFIFKFKNYYSYKASRAKPCLLYTSDAADE